MAQDPVPEGPLGVLVSRRGQRGRARQRPKGVPPRSLGALCCCFFLTFFGSSSFGGDKDAGTAFNLTLRGLETVGGFPPPPAWAPYYPPWWGWGWGGPGPYPPPPYLSQPYLQPGAPTPPAYPLQVKPAGRLVVLTNPIDADVYVDGVRLQQQPNLSYDVGLLAGPHQVDIRREGFKPFSYKADIPPGGGIVLPVELEKQ
ncbi:MAG TPA: PEGA domain-containing protein [Thermoanaerobaculaceae bacterium]|nr:PEGA domain-containing protein [Thermoanaerobaculaceae bacterium]